jgi:ABC-type Zn uptake system ZnuABC Zn-binding protein ZnuA
MRNGIMEHRRSRFVLLDFLWIFGMVAWAGLSVLAAASPSSAKINVAASILPLGDFCQKIGGDLAEVQVLVPPGASPHVFEPSPSAVAKATAAQIFVYVGAGLDPWAARLLKAQKNPQRVVVEAAAGVDLIQDVHHHGHEKHEGAKPGAAKHHHHHEGGNPHIWLDPALAQDICRRIAQALIQVDPEHKQAYEANLAQYERELEDLDRDIKETVATFRQRDYVCFHPAYTYFSRRYGLKEVGVIEAAPGREPSPGHLQKIIAAIKRTGVKAVFAEPQFSPRVAEVIAKEAGVKVLFIDPLGGPPPYGSDYIKLMRHNLTVLAQALK